MEHLTIATPATIMLAAAPPAPPDPPPAAIRLRTRPASGPQPPAAWENGSACFVPTGAPRKPFTREEDRPGFLGRTETVAKGRHRAWAWKAGAYVLIGEAETSIGAMFLLPAPKG